MSKQTFRLNHIKAIETGFRFNIDRIYEMHNLIRQVASMQDMPNCSNPIVLNVIKQCKDYVDLWDSLKESYPGGVPVVHPYVDIEDGDR